MKFPKIQDLNANGLENSLKRMVLVSQHGIPYIIFREDVIYLYSNDISDFELTKDQKEKE
jgi:hypothetical protein